MTYQTILAHLPNPASAPRILGVGVDLARRHNSHLTGLHVVPVVQYFYAAAAVQVATEVYDAQQQEFDREAEEIEKIFNREAPADVKPEWRCLRAGGPVAAADAVGQAMCADLIVTGQRDPDAPMDDGGGDAERLVMETGRPVLVVPYAGKVKSLGENVLIAWNGKREAARAVFDALPLLKQAKKVTLLWANPGAEEGGGEAGVAGAELAAALARHDVNVETARAVSKELDVGDVLLSRAADEAADMIVMGAYGHSRLREYVFGGATRHVLEHMTVPVLLSH